jgi:hypothetical protein
MAIVTSYDWESDNWTEHHHGDTPTRAAWRQAVADIAAKAKAKLPECNGRVDSAVKIVLAGDVELLADGTATVASQSNGSTAYRVVNGHCDCRDYDKSPYNFCKHRLSVAIARRAQELTRAQLDAPATTAAQADQSAVDMTPEPSPTLNTTTGQLEASKAISPPQLPEAPVSITLKATLHGHEVLVTLRGTDFASVKVQVEAASQWLQAQGGTAAAADTPQCPIHHVPMKQQTNAKGTWYSHKTLNGWCKGR